MASTSVGDCTLETCPVRDGFLLVAPSLEGAAFMLGVFAALALVNVWTGARCKTKLYSLTLVAGLLLEVMGYIGRLLLRSDLANKRYFLLFLLGTTLGPTFITAALYTVLPHIIALYGSDVNIVPEPCWLSYFFFFFDAFTIIFQTFGSAFAVEGYSKVETQQGVNILVAGLGIQIASILVFFAAYFCFMSRVVHNREFLDPRFSDVYLSARFKTALLCTQLALAFILARTVARMVQFLSGLESALSQSQVYVLVLDGALVLLAAILVTLVPPAPALGRAWGPTSPSKRKAGRHLAALYPAQHSPGSPFHHVPGSSFSSPRGHQIGYGYGLASGEEPRSPPPSFSTDTTAGVPAYTYHTDVSTTPADMRRFSPQWSSTHKRQASANFAEGTELPPYERSANNYARVPYVPPRNVPLSQQYGQGTIVESQIVAPGSDGSRTGGPGSGDHSGSYMGRTRRSPRAFDDDLVRHDAIW